MHLLLIGVGAQELLGSYDPRPRGRKDWREENDPFDDPGRPLRLAIGTDVARGDPDTWQRLLRLAQLPHVELHLMPGIHASGSGVIRETEFPGDISWLGITNASRPLLSQHPGRTANASQSLAEVMFPELGAMAPRLVFEGELHEEIGTDFLVSDALAAQRGRRSGWWVRQHGICTTREAFRLGGTKARMYAAAPVLFQKWGTTTMNVGLWRDRALMRFLPILQMALYSVHGPDCQSWERGSAEQLLAIRALLLDLMIARDAVFRLVRSDASRPVYGGRRLGRDPQPGAQGNDLLQLLAYHALAALNHLFAASESLSEVMVNWCAVARGRRRMGFRDFVAGRAKPLARSAAAINLRGQLLSMPETNDALVLRDIRNLWVHQDGVELGRIGLDPKPQGSLEMFGLWLTRDRFEGDWGVLTRMSRYADAGLAVLSFDDLLDSAWRVSLGLIGGVLAKLDWSSMDWIRADEDWREHQRFARGWDTSFQRLLYGT